MLVLTTLLTGHFHPAIIAALLAEHDITLDQPPEFSSESAYFGRREAWFRDAIDKADAEGLWSFGSRLWLALMAISEADIRVRLGMARDLMREARTDWRARSRWFEASQAVFAEHVRRMQFGAADPRAYQDEHGLAPFPRAGEDRTEYIDRVTTWAGPLTPPARRAALMDNPDEQEWARSVWSEVEAAFHELLLAG